MQPSVGGAAGLPRAPACPSFRRGMEVLARRMAMGFARIMWHGRELDAARGVVRTLMDVVMLLVRCVVPAAAYDVAFLRAPVCCCCCCMTDEPTGQAQDKHNKISQSAKQSQRGTKSKVAHEPDSNASSRATSQSHVRPISRPRAAWRRLRDSSRGGQPGTQRW